MRRAEICLRNILQGGKTCKNPKITWTQSGESCLLVNCVDDNCVTVQIPDDCETKCLEFILDCDDCDQCPPVIIRRCLCDALDECPNCEECIDGFCTPIECPDQVCDPDTGDCVDCVSSGDCPCDQVCINNQCQCADPSQFINDKGCCVDCLSNADCAECENCVGGTCVPVVCPDGICNPANNTCVECLVGGDCSGDNECCINNRCACCPGYYRNSEGDCVELPDCISDGDCPLCFVCVDGECKPLICPVGKVCIDGRCEDECDCWARDCKGNKVCVSNSFGVCYCKDCTGGCDADCIDPCECIGQNCVAKPCYGPCISGNDCGEGCGCLNGECVPCDSLDCDICDTSNGCSCLGGVCVDDPCTNFCTSGEDCIGNCGCDIDSYECVSCESVSCQTNANCPEGCYCDNGVCRKSPCAHVTCDDANDCGQGCGCDNGICVPCSSLNCQTAECANVEGCECNPSGVCVDDNLGCQEIATLTKNGQCELRAELTTGCCSCSDIFANVSSEYVGVSNNNAEYNVGLTLFKDGSPLNASPNIAEDLPISGSVRFRLVEVYRRWSNNPLLGFLPGTVIGTSLSPVISLSGTHVANHTFTNTTIGISNILIPAPNKTITISGLTYRVWSRRIEMWTPNSLQIINECRYGLPLPATSIYNNIYSNFQAPQSPVTKSLKLVREVNCRVPLFTLVKANTISGLNAGTEYKNYATRVGNSNLFRKDYTNFPEVEYGKFYRLKPGCGCAADAFYSCSGNNIPTPLTLCTPIPPLQYTISNCGKRITFDEDVVITCPAYLAAGASKPVYDLYINNIVVSTYTLGVSPATILIPSSTEVNSSTCITSVELRQRLDICNQCDISKNHTCSEVSVSVLSVSAPCDDPTDAVVQFVISGGSAPYDFDLKVNGISIDDDTENSAGIITWNGTIPLNGVLVIEVEDDDGCLAVSAPFVYNLGQNNISNSVGLSALCNPRRVRITNNSNTVIIANVTGVQSGITIGAGQSFNVPVNTDGVYTVTAVASGDSSCTFSGTVTVGCCVPDPFANTSYTYNNCNWTFQGLPNNGIEVIITLNGVPIVGNYACLGVGPQILRFEFNGCVREFTLFLP
jgi:hypothetical protein